MLTHLFLELVDTLLIHLSSRELSALLGLVRLELEHRGDTCASNHVARAKSAHDQWLAEYSSRVRPQLEGCVDSGDGASLPR